MSAKTTSHLDTTQRRSNAHGLVQHRARPGRYSEGSTLVLVKIAKKSLVADRGAQPPPESRGPLRLAHSSYKHRPHLPHACDGPIVLSL
ncbi:hypothetical protein QC761_0098120 [Podospora bellae-mahoneyi]|uniref:Uncharacterized protein n=1 Tax=Podospora bellae-mahoneyi TaxID=2093777 RepID=A0ABR0FAM7_9PEZI|nr:hypothetical protein QC761_0098120 [Podospora bellae-mahoneyi]